MTTLWRKRHEMMSREPLPLYHFISWLVVGTSRAAAWSVPLPYFNKHWLTSTVSYVTKNLIYREYQRDKEIYTFMRICGMIFLKFPVKYSPLSSVPTSSEKWFAFYGFS